MKQLRHDLLIVTLTVTHSHYEKIHPKNKQIVLKDYLQINYFFMGTWKYTSIQQWKNLQGKKSIMPKINGLKTYAIRHHYISIYLFVTMWQLPWSTIHDCNLFWFVIIIYAYINRYQISMQKNMFSDKIFITCLTIGINICIS